MLKIPNSRTSTKEILFVFVAKRLEGVAGFRFNAVAPFLPRKTQDYGRQA
jgi:hypothetical protein